MPVVPRYDAQVAPGISRATQNIQASPDAFGAAQGRALQSVSQGLDIVAQRAEQIQNERDEVSARQAFIAASGEARERMRGEGGYLTRQGEDAFNSYGDFAREVDDIGGRYAQGLSPNAQRAYDQLWASRREGILNSGATHAANQRNAHAQMVFEAGMIDSRNNAIESYNQSREFNAFLESGADNIRSRLAAQGIRDSDDEDGPRPVQVAVDAWRSETIRLSITAALDNGDIAGAEALFEAREDFLVGADRETARALIRNEGMLTEMQAAAADIFEQFGTDRAGARRYIRENWSGQEEQTLLSLHGGLLSEHEDEMERSRREVQRSTLELLQNGAQWEDLSSSQRAALPEATQIRLMERRPLATDPQRNLEVMTMAPEELAKVDLLEVYTWANESDFNRIESRVTAAIRAEEEGREVSRAERVRVESQRAAVERIAGLNRVTDVAQINEIMTDLQQAVTERENELNEPMGQAEFEEFVDNYTRLVVFDRPRGRPAASAAASAPGHMGAAVRLISPGQDRTRASTVLSENSSALGFAQQSHRQAVVLAASAMINEYPDLGNEVDTGELARLYREVIDNAAPGTITPYYIERTMLRLFARDVNQRAGALAATQAEEE